MPNNALVYNAACMKVQMHVHTKERMQMDLAVAEFALYSYPACISSHDYLPIETSLGPEMKSKSDSTLNVIVLSLRLGT